MAERLDECLNAADAGGVRFELDDRAERGAAALRAVGAVVTIGAGVWLFALPYMTPRLFALAGFAFGGLWLVRAVRMLRNVQRKPATHYLELRPNALILCEGGAEQIVRWEEITQVAIDEDRLLVVVERSNSAALLLEPQYRGVGLRPLAEAVQKGLVRSRQSALGTQAAHG
jgi:hypothetical protein